LQAQAVFAGVPGADVHGEAGSVLAGELDVRERLTGLM
jgi:hypothetical protein